MRNTGWDRTGQRRTPGRSVNPASLARSATAVVIAGMCASACSDPAGDIGGPSRHAVMTLEAVASPSAAVASNSWQVATALPQPLTRLAATTVNNGIYTMGGVGAGGVPVTNVYLLAPSARVWTSRAPLPAARAETDGATVIGSTIYLAGGRNATGGYTRSLYAYNTATNSWTVKAKIPVDGGCGGSVAIGTSLYVGHGCNATGAAKDFYRYDSATNSWTVLASPASPHRFGAMYLVSGRIHWASGYTSATTMTSTIERYDIATNSWSPVSNIPESRAGAAVGVVNDVPVLSGGMNLSGFPFRTDYYDPAADSWHPRASRTAANVFPATAVLQGKLYVLGGEGSVGTATSQVEVYTPGDYWLTLAPMPTARGYHAGAVTAGRLYAVGGRAAGSTTVLDVNEAYDPVTNTWTTRAPLPSPRWGAAAASTNGKLYVIGGFLGSSPAIPTNTLYEYTAATNSWAVRAPLPAVIGYATATTVNGRLYVLNGGDGSIGGTLGMVWYEYNPTLNSWAAIAPSPVSFSRGGATAFLGRLYAAGGYGVGLSLQRNLAAWNPVTNSWGVLPSLPFDVFGNTLRGVGTDLIVIGGSDALGNKPGAVELFDTATLSWRAGMSQLLPRAHMVSAVYNGGVITAGGWPDNATAATQTDIYVPF